MPTIISSGTMNAKLPIWIAVVQFLPVKVLVCVYVDHASPKSPTLQIVSFYQMPSPVFCVCNFYNGNSTLKRCLVWYRYVQYFCYVGMTQHKQYLMQLCFQFQENCQRYLSSFIYDKSWSNELTILSALKSDSHLPKIVLLFPLLKSLQNWWKMFLFHLKSSFRSQDI